MNEKPQSPPDPAAATRLPLRVAALSTRRANRFHLRPDAEGRAAIAAELDLVALRKLDFRGALQAEGRQDWRLEGQLGATVVQTCVISAEPVTTRIDLPVTRLFRDDPTPGPAAQEGGEAEMPEDDRIEPLGSEIDPGAVMIEALALALPDYPRKPGTALGEDGALVAAPPGAAPIDEGAAHPFAALAALRRGNDDGAGDD